MSIRGTLRIFSALLLVGSLSVLPRNLDSLQGPGGATEGITVPDYFMRQARYVIMDDGRLESEMFADQATVRFETHEFKADIVHGDFWDENGQLTKMQSEKANYHMDKRLLHLIGDVVCETSDHFFMLTDEANYDLNTRFFKTLQDVYGYTQDEQMKFWADRGESFVNTRTANLYGDARSEYIDAKNGLTKIRGDRALLDRSEQAVTYFDNVRILQDKMRVKSKIASLFYSQTDKQVEYLLAQEDVEMEETSGRHTRSREAQFYTPANTIVLLGFPSVYDKDDVITGDKITFYRNTGVVEVTSANSAFSDATREKATPQEFKEVDEAPLSEEDEELIP